MEMHENDRIGDWVYMKTDPIHILYDLRAAKRLELCASAASLWTDLPKQSNSPRIRNWPSTDVGDVFEFNQNGVRLLLDFTTAGLVYGGTHLCAWNTFFSSNVQFMLWRVSSITLAGSGVFMMTYALCFSGSERLQGDGQYTG